THGRKALFNHIWVYIFLFFANLGFIFSREVFDKPFDNQGVISNVSLGIGIFLLLIAGIIFLFNIIRGIKLLTDKSYCTILNWTTFSIFIFSLFDRQYSTIFYYFRHYNYK